MADKGRSKHEAARIAAPCQTSTTDDHCWVGRKTRHDGGVDDVPITDDMIRFGQFLEAGQPHRLGSDARILLEDGSVRVNGESNWRRGRQLHRGDVVTVQDHQVAWPEVGRTKGQVYPWATCSIHHAGALFISAGGPSSPTTA